MAISHVIVAQIAVTNHMMGDIFQQSVIGIPEFSKITSPPAISEAQDKNIPRLRRLPVKFLDKYLQL